LLGGCAADEESGPHAIYLGEVPGTDAVVAFVVDEAGIVNSYVCGGPSSYAELSRWFCGESDDAGGAREFVKIEDGWHMEAIVGEDLVDGTMTSVDGTALSFTAARAAPGSRTDLFGADDLGGCATGAIVIDDGGGAEPRVQGTFCEEDADGRIYEQVTPLAPPAAGETHMQVGVWLAGVERQVLLARIRP
jgi:hypothetical protein